MRRIIGLVAALLGVAGCAGEDCPFRQSGYVVMTHGGAWPEDAPFDCRDTLTPGACEGSFSETERPMSLGSIGRELVGVGGEALESGTSCEPEALVSASDGSAVRVAGVYVGEGLYTMYARVTQPSGAVCCYTGRLTPDVRDL